MPLGALIIAQSIPALEPFYFEFEKTFDVSEYYRIIRDNPIVPVVATALYLLMVFGGQAIMANRKPFNLKKLTAWWNLFLALFSIIGAVRVVPHFFYLFTFKTFKQTVCEAPITVRTNYLEKLPVAS